MNQIFTKFNLIHFLLPLTSVASKDRKKKRMLRRCPSAVPGMCGAPIRSCIRVTRRSVGDGGPRHKGGAAGWARLLPAALVGGAVATTWAVWWCTDAAGAFRGRTGSTAEGSGALTKTTNALTIGAGQGTWVLVRAPADTSVTQPTTVKHVPSAESLSRWCADHDVDYPASDMLDGAFVISDVDAPGEPIVVVSQSFVDATGYAPESILGRKCNFLQGRSTDARDVARCSELVRERQEGFVKLLNYRRDGSSFANVLYLAPLKEASRDGRARFMIGLQCDLSDGVPSKPSSGSSAKSGAFESRVTLRNATATARPNGERGLSFPPIEDVLESAEVRLQTRTHPALDPRVHAAFVDNARQFDLEFAFRLAKAVPASELFVNIYLDEPPALNRAWKILRRIAIGTFTATHGDGAFIDAGDEAPGGRPYISVPLHDFFHDVTESASGDGSSGDDGGVSDALPRDSKLAGRGQILADGYRPGRLYTARVYSNFGDMERWQVTNLPGINALDLNRFTSRLPLHISMSVRPPSAPRSSAVDVLRFDVIHQSCKE
jgi:PAS domain-containing protein